MTLTVSRRGKLQTNGLHGAADFFRAVYVQADQEQRVELIGNYLQLLWRNALAAGLSRKSPEMQKLDGLMGTWWAWRQQYHEAVLRRWIPFTRPWSEELDQWADRVTGIQSELDGATSNLVTARLARQGLDSDMIAPEASDSIVSATLERTRQLLKSPLFWPVVGVVSVLVLAGFSLKIYKDMQHLGGGFTRG